MLQARLRMHASGDHDGSVDLLITGCEVSLWLGMPPTASKATEQGPVPSWPAFVAQASNSPRTCTRHSRSSASSRCQRTRCLGSSARHFQFHRLAFNSRRSPSSSGSPWCERPVEHEPPSPRALVCLGFGPCDALTTCLCAAGVDYLSLWRHLCVSRMCKPARCIHHRHLCGHL